VKFLWQLFWDPVGALDLYGESGRVDHGKIIGFFTFLTMLLTILLYVLGIGKLIPLGHTVALISTAYGWASWRAFLKSKAAVAKEQRSERTDVRNETVTLNTEPNIWTDDERG